MTTIDGRRGYFSIASSPGPIPELDGFRGIAILLVLLRHAARPIFDEHGEILPLGSWDIAVPLLNGWMGVDLFFVLSGFLIAHHLLKHWPTQLRADFLRRYWLKRVLRTVPAYYAVLVVVGAGLLPFYRPTIEHMASDVFVHALFLQDYYGSTWMSAFWSLGVEEKFYLLCPFVLLWLRNFTRGQQLSILLALTLLPMLLRALTSASEVGGFNSYAHFFWTVRSPFHLAMDGFWLGVMCALIYRWRPSALAGNHSARQILLLVGMSLFATVLLSVAWFDGRYFRSSIVVLGLVPLSFAAMILAVIHGSTFISAWLRSRWLRFMAEISYSVYLTHLLVVGPAIQLAKLLSQQTSSTSPMLEFAWFLPVFISFSLIAGLILHFTVEKPFLLLKNRVSDGATSPLNSVERGTAPRLR